MAKMTLLAMVQDILTSMDSDQVNSITDTVESEAVAQIIKTTYQFLFSNIEVPERVGMIQLTGVGDLDRPNYLRIPDNVLSISWLRYRDGSDGRYKLLYYMNEEEFFQKVLNNNTTTSDVDLVTDDSGITFYVKNNQQPTYYTIINDKYIITDSYDSDYDSTLQASKTFVWGEKEDTWTASDTFVPNIDADLFPLLLSEAKSAAFIELKQVVNAKAEDRSRKGRVHLQYRKFKDKRQRQDYFEGPNYARNR